MMKIQVHEDYFQQAESVREEIKQAGLFSLEMEVPPVSNKSHWHAFTTQFYILAGELQISDTLAKKVMTAGPGSRVDVPARLLHSEHSASGYRIIAGMSVDPSSLSGPVDLPPDLLEQKSGA